MALSRRTLLKIAALAALPSRTARADVAPDERKFLFVVNYGGWDTTRVFAPAFDLPSVAVEAEAQTAVAGGLSFVDHPARPSVRAFFEAWAHRSAIVNGILIPSVAHDHCLRLAMTGTGAQDAADMPAILAGELAERYILPHVAVSGPSFPGRYGSSVTRSGSSDVLVGLLSGDLLDAADVPINRLDWRAEQILDRHLAARAAAARAASAGDLGRKAAIHDAFALSIDRSRTLKDLLYVLDWSGGSSFADQASLGLDLLSLGLSRCVTLQYLGNQWDTHSANDASQSVLFEGLFAELGALMESLSSTPASTGGTLADETVVVVLSEMGRTPLLNDNLGKDHWPVTSALVSGPGVAGGRVVGEMDELFYGRPIDPTTGAADDAGLVLTGDVFAGTLLAMGGLSPSLIQSGTQVVSALLV